MPNSWFQPLRRQLVVTVALLVATAVGVGALLAVEEFRETSEELQGETQMIAINTAEAIQRELTGLDRMINNLTANPAVQNLDGPAVEPLLRPQMIERPSLFDVTLFDKSGNVVARGPSDRLDIDKLDVVQKAVHHDRRMMSELQVSSSGTVFVSIAYPVRDASDRVIGVLVCYVDPQRLHRVFREQLLHPQSEVTVTESSGRVVARNLDPDQYVGTILTASTGETLEPPHERDSVDGVRRMFAQAVVPGGPWVVSVGIPMAVASNRAISLWLRTLPVLGLALGGWLVIAFVFSRRLTRSVGHLEVAAQRIAAGDFSPLESRPMPTREFAALQTAFDHMLRRFNETRAALDDQMAEERRMRQEVESLQRQVIRQERLAAVGQLVSGVAHEINNPLQAILGFAELLQMQRDLPEAVKADLVLIQKESARACGIIRNLAMFARQQTGDAELVRLADVVRSVAELRQRRLESENIWLCIEDHSKREVAAVLAELQQVVLNFVVNAEQSIVQSGRRPGRITIRTRDSGDRVILEVEDTGPGVSPEHEARLFQPFFTTKPVGQGTGLGLSVSYGIIDSLGGHMGYRGAPEGGAIFYFDLPAASA